MTGPIVLALSVSLIAGLCAYVITLEEAQHHFPSRRRQQMEALRTGFVAMLFFILLAVAVAFVFSRMFGENTGSPSNGSTGVRAYEDSRATSSSGVAQSRSS